jgi:hypothetical protein
MIGRIVSDTGGAIPPHSPSKTSVNALLSGRESTADAASASIGNRDFPHRRPALRAVSRN